jgi:hypothetical protein
MLFQFGEHFFVLISHRIVAFAKPSASPNLVHNIAKADYPFWWPSLLQVIDLCRRNTSI